MTGRLWDPERAVEVPPRREERYCAACGTKPPGRDCCWFVADEPGAEAGPGELVPLMWFPETMTGEFPEILAAERRPLACFLPREENEGAGGG